MTFKKIIAWPDTNLPGQLQKDKAAVNQSAISGDIDNPFRNPKLIFANTCISLICLIVFFTYLESQSNEAQASNGMEPKTKVPAILNLLFISFQAVILLVQVLPKNKRQFQRDLKERTLLANSLATISVFASDIAYSSLKFTDIINEDDQYKTNCKALGLMSLGTFWLKFLTLSVFNYTNKEYEKLIGTSIPLFAESTLIVGNVFKQTKIAAPCAAFMFLGGNFLQLYKGIKNGQISVIC